MDKNLQKNPKQTIKINQKCNQPNNEKTIPRWNSAWLSFTYTTT